MNTDTLPSSRTAHLQPGNLVRLVIPALRRRMEEDHEFKASIAYKGRLWWNEGVSECVSECVCVSE